MRNSLGFLLILTLIISSCSHQPVITQELPTAVKEPTRTQPIPTAVKVEVTRIVQITTTPAPIKTSTPRPTLDPINVDETQISYLIGTPIVARMECDNAMTQREINKCVGTGFDFLIHEMEVMVNAVKERYGIEEEQNTFLDFQAEWENFVKRECIFRSGYYPVEFEGTTHYAGGSMAPMMFSGCMTGKYEDRLRELQGQLYERTR